MDTSYNFLFDLALILLCTKLLGLATKKVNMPQVVGALLAGLLLGPACFKILKTTTFISNCAEIGVIVLMFCAGMETDIDELKKSGKASFLIALIGVIVPLLGGLGIGFIFNKPGLIESNASCKPLLENIFIGIILTATSVSITVETLKEMGKLKTQAGNAILGAAIIDDILGIIALTVVTSFADPNVNIIMVLLKIVGFFIFIGVIAVAFTFIYKKKYINVRKGLHRHAILAFVFCLLLSYIGEVFFGVADITGAFFAGLIISSTQRTKFLASKFDTLSYLFLSPIFFASIGIKVELKSMSVAVVVFAIILTLIAILTKIVGCGVGAKICGYSTKEAIQIGTGMISRGEVALIVANKGQSAGLLGDNFLGPIVVVVVITTIITPILLKLVFRNSTVTTVTSSNSLGKGYEELDHYRIGN
ncbi:MAG: cation:proton antiporter [bacterium]|nr:cation:proton antiporter [bacterium]